MWERYSAVSGLLQLCEFPPEERYVRSKISNLSLEADTQGVVGGFKNG